MKMHLAQVNVARARAPIDNEIMRPFVEALDQINALAERSAGFVWRFKTESGNATSVVAFDDPRLILNISVWTDIEALQNYVYRTMHGKFFAKRGDWFEKMTGPHLSLWWIAINQYPTVVDAKLRLSSLARNGETPFAFTFRKSFDRPSDASHGFNSDPA
jgi:hypothetical protein